MNLAQRALAILGATGTAALMALPAFAQAVPTQGVVNNGDINRLNNQTQTTDNCAPVNGGVGGPVDSQSANTQPSSYDTARTGVPNNAGSSMSQNSMGSMNQNSMGSMNQSSMGSMMGSNTARNQAAFPTRQFDGNNRSAAIAYRSNGPAGTSGHEAKMNLDAFQERQNAGYPTAYNLGTPQASTSLPVACAPR